MLLTLLQNAPPARTAGMSSLFAMWLGGAAAPAGVTSSAIFLGPMGIWAPLG